MESASVGNQIMGTFDDVQTALEGVSTAQADYTLDVASQLDTHVTGGKRKWLEISRQ